jgi:hypothetical protein
VKFQAQVLGRKATLLLRPYRACHCFTAQTQGDALGMFRKKRTKPCKGETQAVKF